jgi:predicted ATPase
VIGKEFSFGLLRLVAEGEEEDLRGRLSHLQAGEFIYEQPAFPEPEYTFKHALTQEVAYGSLLADRRRPLHERTARAIEELYRDGLDEHYGELAHHYGRTDNTPKAVEYLYLAGEQAAQRSAYAEAIRQLSRGVELVATLPESRERARQELLLQLTLGPALMATQGFTVPEVERAFVRARDLCEQAGEAPHVFRALNGLYTFHLARAEHERAGELAQDLLRLARGTGEAAHLVWAHADMGVTAFWRGELSQAREHLEEAIARYDLQELRSRGFLFYQTDPGVWALIYLASTLYLEEAIARYDLQELRSRGFLFYQTNPGVWALIYLAWTLWPLGYPEQALTRSQESLALARELSHPFTQANALLFANQVHRLRGESRAALEEAEALIALSSEHGFLQYAGLGTFMRAMTLTDQGQLQEGIAGIRAILEAMRSGGTALALPMMLAFLAEAHGKAGQAEEGLALLAEAQGLVAKAGERTSEAGVRRVKGELLLARSPSDEAQAEVSFREALEIARRQSAKSHELRAATSPGSPKASTPPT